jgi:hypothetical protein
VDLKGVGLSGHGRIKECFVAMPITTSEFYIDRCGDSDHFSHVLNHLFRPALRGAGYETVSPSAAGSELIHAEIIRRLEEADLVLCDLSGLNPNVFFELGIRTALDRPLAIVKDNLTPQIPFDLGAVNTLTYDCTLNPWTLSGEIPRLIEHILSSAQAPHGGNAMWRYFGLTKRATPAEVVNNPLEAKIDLIISEITSGRLWQRSGETQHQLAAADVAAPEQVIPDHIAASIRKIEEIARSENVHMLVRYDSESGAILLESDDALPPKLRERIALTTGRSDITIRIADGGERG